MQRKGSFLQSKSRIAAWGPDKRPRDTHQKPVAAGSHNLVVVVPEQLPEQELVPDTVVLAADDDIPGMPVEQEHRKQEHRKQELALEWGMVAGIAAAAVAETMDKMRAARDLLGQVVPLGMPRWGSRRARLRHQSLPTNRP